MHIVADHSSHIFSFPSEATRRAALLNEGPRTTFLTLKKGVSYYSSVDQVIHILERIATRAIIKVERTENQLIEAIRNAKLLHERVSLYSCCSYFSIYVYCSYSVVPLVAKNLTKYFLNGNLDKLIRIPNRFIQAAVHCRNLFHHLLSTVVFPE